MSGRGPYYWMVEVSGVLQDAIQAHHRSGPMTPLPIGAMRAYFRQWVTAQIASRFRTPTER
jgi:hypothetical protein